MVIIFIIITDININLLINHIKDAKKTNKTSQFIAYYKIILRLCAKTHYRGYRGELKHFDLLHLIWEITGLGSFLRSCLLQSCFQNYYNVNFIRNNNK